MGVMIFHGVAFWYSSYTSFFYEKQASSHSSNISIIPINNIYRLLEFVRDGSNIEVFTHNIEVFTIEVFTVIHHQQSEVGTIGIAPH
jgi:hypothetical protein